VSIDQIPLPRTAGKLWLCGRNDVGPDPEAALAWADGATTVVCLLPVAELSTRFPSYVEWLRGSVTDRAIWLPIANFGAPSARTARPIVDAIVARLEAGHGVLMHCALGQGRAGTMAALVLIALGLDADEAVRTVASHRVFGGPANADQWRLVDEFAALVSGG
jgi:protein-tyrosine phosphatase